MRGVIVGLLMMLALSGFVFAVSSETTTGFYVKTSQELVVSDVSAESSVGDYTGYAILAFIVLVLFYFINKRDKVSKKKVSKRSKRKK